MDENPFASLTDFEDFSIGDPPDDQVESSSLLAEPLSPVHEELREDDLMDVDLMDVDLPHFETSSFVPVSMREDAPMIDIIEPEYRNIDPRTYFPEFDPNGVLRFSRLLESAQNDSNKHLIWWMSRTFNAESQQETTGELRLNIGPNASKSQCVRDQADLLLKTKDEQEDEDDDKPAVWRYGPAQIWYDRLGLPENPQNFDYGFKTNPFNDDSKEPLITRSLTNEELLPVNLFHWEDDIIMDSSEIDFQEAANDQKSKCGWVVTEKHPTYQSCKAGNSHSNAMRNGPDRTHSMFPTSNYELENIRWEDDIILDSDNMPSIPKPRVLTLEYEDDPSVFEAPQDILVEAKDKKAASKKKHQATKKSKIILNQVLLRQKREEDEHMEIQVAQDKEQEAFNMSNDDYYAPKKLHRSTGFGVVIHHSIPAQNIHRAFFPTYLSADALRQLNRQPASKRVMEYLVDRIMPIHNSLNFVADAEEKRKRHSMADLELMTVYTQNVRDLSARGSTLVCIEYSEEHPPLLSQPGMASKIRNYCRRSAQTENNMQFEFGETASSITSPFLVPLNDDQVIQTIENNMYRAPIFKHKMPTTDFILIRCADGLFLRECSNAFVAGQECPLYEVPIPNSKKATAFNRDFLLAYIYRLLWKSEYQPRRLIIDDVKSVFPETSDPTIRSRLKQCTKFVRSAPGFEHGYWEIKSDFRLPSKEDILAMLTPEMCCSHYAIKAAECRLKDAGYGDVESNEDSDEEVTLEDEIKCAPWNTTRAYIMAANGKCLLDQSGIADPTGCGQGFSYVRVPKKSQKENKSQTQRRSVTGTKADLRKLSRKEAEEFCRNNGLTEEEIKALTRWELVDVVRTMSTESAKNTGNLEGVGRFARGKLWDNTAEVQESYKQYCQHVFDLQNKVLASSEQLNTDVSTEDESSDEDDMALRLEHLLTNDKSNDKSGTSRKKKSAKFEDEEKDRLELQQMIKGETTIEKSINADDSKQANTIRRLQIHRVFVEPDGSESTKIEVIDDQDVINRYEFVRTNHDEKYIRVFAVQDKEYKEGLRREKRRLQDRIRRLNRKEQESKKPVSPIKPSSHTMKCGACGQIGHMKTNKKCPNYGKEPEKKEKTIGDICKIKF